MRGARSVLILGALFIALLVGILIISDEDNQPLISAERNPTATTALFNRVYPDLEVLAIQAIRLWDPNSGAELILARDLNGQWTAPALSGTLDTDIATQIAQTVVLLPYLERFGLIEGESLTPYGFRPEGSLFVVQFVTITGEQRIIAIGNPVEETQNALGEPAYYALIDDRLEMFLVHRAPINFLIGFLIEPPVN